jgi:peptide/nickel transport system substrate-binding protein
MNDLVCENEVVIPVVNRPKVQAFAKTLRAQVTSWDNDMAHLRDWFREA